MSGTPDANILLQIVLVAVLLGNAIAIWLGLLNRKSIQRREVSFTEPPASKREFDQHAQECREDRGKLWTELTADRRNHEIHISQRSASIYAQIDKVRIELTENQEQLRADMQRNFQDTERALGRIEGKLDQRKSS